jgi:asparagine synthase (glutamine-hydrolysing)
LPKEILWRQKEQFSDGVGYAWIDSLKQHAAEQVTDKQLGMAAHVFPYNTPLTKEAYFIRSCFEERFPQQSAIQTVVYEPSIACSTATAVAWDEEFKKVLGSNGEQSGRAVKGVHLAAYTDVAASAHGKK